MSFLYFARAADLIWLGTTQNPHSPPAVLGYMKGGEVELLAIRQRFAHLRNGEAFRAEPELLAFIETHCERPEVKREPFELPKLPPRRTLNAAVAMIRAFLAPRKRA